MANPDQMGNSIFGGKNLCGESRYVVNFFCFLILGWVGFRCGGCVGGEALPASARQGCMLARGRSVVPTGCYRQRRGLGAVVTHPTTCLAMQVHPISSLPPIG